jgi:AcrR family transcriptional regulator
MARISKEYDERLNEFLDTAQQLFFERGYEQTSVNHIIEKVGVAKGTFYHYFKTKSELLDKLVSRFGKRLREEIEPLMEQPGLNAIDKLNLFFEKGRSIKAQNVDLMMMFMKVLYTDDNLRLRHEMNKKNTVLVAPLISSILEQGIREGTVSVIDPYNTALLLYSMMYNLAETTSILLLHIDEHPENMDEIERKVKVLEYSVEKILGVPEGSLCFANRQFMEQFSNNRGKSGKTNSSKNS